MRVPKFDTVISGQEAVEKLLWETQYKLVANYTNVLSIKSIIADIKRELAKPDCDYKTLEIGLDEQTNNLMSNIKAIKIHTKHIEFLKSNLK